MKSIKSIFVVLFLAISMGANAQTTLKEAMKAFMQASPSATNMTPETMGTALKQMNVGVMTNYDAEKSNQLVDKYLKEKFYEWRKERPDITIIENPYYDTCNNISSLYVAREHLDDCIILDGDQIIYNPDILEPHFNLSGYNAVWCDGETDEWLMDVEDDVVKSCSRTGGSHGWQLYSISRWSQSDGERLRHHLEQEFESGNRDIYWDDVAMFCHFKDYKLGIREMKASDIIEIDDLDELIQIDESYEKYKKPEMAQISGGNQL